MVIVPFSVNLLALLARLSRDCRSAIDEDAVAVLRRHRLYGLGHVLDHLQTSRQSRSTLRVTACCTHGKTRPGSRNASGCSRLSSMRSWTCAAGTREEGNTVLQVGPESGVEARVPATGARNQGCSAEAKEIAYRLKPSGLDTFLFEHSGILAPVPPKLSDDPKTLCIPASIVSHILSWDRQNLLHFARHIGRHQREDKWVRIVGPGSIFEAKNSVEVIFRLYQFNKCGHDPITHYISC